LIFLAFLLPLAIYLLGLGFVNRRPQAVMVSGTWDFLGLVFAASGFLLFGGPGLLSSLNERWRVFWLFGRREAADPSGEDLWQFWIFLSVLYFIVVVAGVSYLLWRQRALTSIYNVEPGTVERALAQVCARLGLSPTRSGNLFLFGMAPTGPPSLKGASGATPAGNHLSSAGRVVAAALAGSPAAQGNLLNEMGILEVDTFAAMRHVTLRWDPPDSALRQSVETELGRALADVAAPETDLGAWFTLVGIVLIAGAFLGAIVLFIVRLLRIGG
jgi:hypothetical protein